MIKIKKYLPVLIMLIFSILLAACVPSTAQERTIDVETLYNDGWLLVAYGNAEGLSIVTPGLRTKINFQQDGSLFGNAGCNRFFGNFKAAQDGTLSVEEPLGSTMMFCEQFMDEEAVFLAGLQSANGFSFNELGQLMMTLADSQTGYDFMLLKNQQSSPLLGSGWVLDKLVTPNGELDVSAAHAPVLNLSEDNSMTGNGGCNTISSQFTIENGNITFGPIASTRMFCEGVMDLEAGFTLGLEQVTRYEITGNRLVLSDESFATTLYFFATEFMLTETQWQLAVLNGEDLPATVEATLFLSPADENRAGTMFGSTGCNRYSGNYTLEGDQLTLNVLIITAMECENRMEIESAFLTALQNPLTFQIQFNRLNLSSERDALVFIGQAPSVSGNWRVASLGDSGNLVELTFEQTILASFSIEEDANTGTISGTTPCQAFTARFFTDQNLITIVLQDLVDLNQCQGISELDTQLYETLEKAARFELNLGNLVLFDADGTQLLQFAPQTF